ncbi:MAG: methyltransferase domain-containing protein [Gammaproteobacteria bacterium]|nr:methyltransferase domain-containing protein [Gammaproteobacteria bacterium]
MSIQSKHKAQHKWDNIYQRHADRQVSAQPAHVLTEFSYLLPETGKSLDLACGRGGNALFLAEKGFDSHAWDISRIVLDQLNTQAEQLQLNVSTRCIDIESAQLPSTCFDVIVVSYFLNRSICEQIASMLKSGGLLFYQTFTVDNQGQGPGNPDYLLERNELLVLFRQLQLIAYQEDGITQQIQSTLSGQAYLVGCKP